MKLNLIVLGLCLFISNRQTLGSYCDSIEGIWYNQHGSEIIFNQNEAKLTGELRTAVERVVGAAGTSYSHVTGISTLEKSSGLVGFTAIFNGGGSVTSWLGHCSKCGDSEVLRTTWLLKKDSTCSEEWMSTHINEDVFERTEKVEGPRKKNGIHTPPRLSSLVQPPTGFSGMEIVFAPKDSKLNGTWVGIDGSLLELSVSGIKGNITGSYKSGRKMTMLFGTSDVQKADEIFGFNAISEEGSYAEAWVGQHRICKGEEILDISIIQGSDVNVCDEKSTFQVSYRKMKFTRPIPTSTSPKTLSTFSGLGEKLTNFFSRWFK